MTRLVVPRDISIVRTRAWSPPTRAWDTGRGAPGVPAVPAAVITGAEALTGGRNLARDFLRLLRLKLV